MKTKLLTLALFGILTIGFVSCSEEEVKPSEDVELNQKSTKGGLGGIVLRDR